MIRLAIEAGPQDLIAAGRQQGIQPARFRTHLQLKVDQLLETMAARLEAEPVRPQQHRCAVAVAEGVGYAGTHAGTGLASVLSEEMVAATK